MYCFICFFSTRSHGPLCVVVLHDKKQLTTFINYYFKKNKKLCLKQRVALPPSPSPEALEGDRGRRLKGGGLGDVDLAASEVVAVAVAVAASSVLGGGGQDVVGEVRGVDLL